MRRLAAALVLAVAAGCAFSSLQGQKAAQPGRPPTPDSSWVGGNDARLLVDGPQTHAAMFAAIQGARDHVNLQTYILEAGEIGERLADLVQKKAAQGVKVNILYDSVGSISTPKEYFDKL